jgi:molybdate transport system substrate-binding protein
MDINVLTVPALKQAFLEFVPRFESTSAHRVTTVFSGTDEIMTRMKAGENGVDFVILDAGSIAELTRLGRTVPESRVDFAKSRVGGAVRAGAARPDIGSVAALRGALLSAGSIAYSRSLSGIHLAGLIEKWGMAEQLRARIKLPKPGEFVGDMVARGEAEIGFQQMSELVHVAGIDLLGPIPSDIQLVTVVSGCVHAESRQPGGANAWANFLGSPVAAAILMKNGLDPE